MSSLIRPVGLITAPVAWALSTQIGQITPHLDCRHGLPLTAGISALLFTASAGGIVSAYAAPGKESASRRFIGRVGFLIAAMALFALAMQGAATLLLNPCQY